MRRQGAYIRSFQAQTMATWPKAAAAAMRPPPIVKYLLLGAGRSTVGTRQLVHVVVCLLLSPSMCSCLASSWQASSKGVAPWLLVANQSAPADVVVSSPRARYLDSRRVHTCSTRSKHTAGMRLHLCSSHLLRSGYSVRPPWCRGCHIYGQKRVQALMAMIVVGPYRAALQWIEAEDVFLQVPGT
jgi:hypothetical protein